MPKRTFALLLLLTAWIGLFGQQVAFAQSADLARPTVVTQQMGAMGGADCAGMAMKSASKDKNSAPCKKMTSDCIAQMNCAAPVVLNDALGPTMATAFASEIYDRTLASFLAGRSDGPEPHPPSLI